MINKNSERILAQKLLREYLETNTESYLDQEAASLIFQKLNFIIDKKDPLFEQFWQQFNSNGLMTRENLQVAMFLISGLGFEKCCETLGLSATSGKAIRIQFQAMSGRRLRNSCKSDKIH